MAPKHDDHDDLARLHDEVDRMRTTVERGPGDDLWRRTAEGVSRETGEPDERRSQRPRSDPAAWPGYRRVEAKPERRMSDAFGWTLVVIALIVLIVVIIGAAYILHSLITAVLLPLI
jgi:hypothetical protein